jgi:hypothetical protein
MFRKIGKSLTDNEAFRIRIHCKAKFCHLRTYQKVMLAEVDE